VTSGQCVVVDRRAAEFSAPRRRKNSTVAEVGNTRASFLEADARIAGSLGLSAYRAAELMTELWGRSFSDERDRRGGPGANAQKRGRISRDLKQELQGAIDGNNQ